jgi:membrane protease subunit HflC
MFDKLIDFILNQIKNIIPFVIIFQFQNGVRYTFGRKSKVLKPGIHFKFPYVQTVLSDNVVDTTMVLPAQSVITSDGKELIVKGVVGFSIENIEDFYNKVYDTRSAISDKTCIIIRNTISVNEFETCITNVGGINDALTEDTQSEVAQYGIKINFVALIDLTESPSFRLFNETLQLG